MVPSLKDPEGAAFIRSALKRLAPAVIVTTTAFAAGGEGAASPLDGTGAPVLQVVIATTRRAAWQDSPRGLGPADLAMNVVLPELDGRVLFGAIAFKDALPRDDALAFTAFASRPEHDRVAMVADRIEALVRLQQTKRAERRIAVLMPDYPAAGGRAGYAVGLDVPASVIALLADLAEAGYGVADAPRSSSELLQALETGAAAPRISLRDYRRYLAALPDAIASRIEAAWGAPEDDPDCRDGAFGFRAAAFGHVLVALPPERGRSSDRRATYHDPNLPPRHAVLAFGLWLRHGAKADAIVHMGAHGTLEWLPGKAVALTGSCFPEAVVGPLPVIYPFIVSNPGEAAQAKRRIAAVTIGHLPPPLTSTALTGGAQELERLVDEYAIADGLDRRRRELLARLIVETARATGLATEAGVAGDHPDEALRKIDSWLCDLKDLAIKDGLHIYGRATATNMADPAWQASAEAERVSIITALDGRRVGPGPAGAPQRGRRDVLPTGRNLFTADPRLLPTPTAMDLGRLAADELVRLYLQTHGEMPRSLVIDLWGSATLRTGGEEIAQGLALMGCRPSWDKATGRVTGIEVLPTAAMGRPRVDVTWRISGLFRDLFPAQIALIDAATRLLAERDEDDDENPLAAASRTARGNGRRKVSAHLRRGPRRLWRGRRGAARRGERSGRDRRGLSCRNLAFLRRRRGRGRGTAGGFRGAGRLGRSSSAWERRSFPRSARRRRGRRPYRRLRRGGSLARARGRSHRPRHDRSQPPARAAARRGPCQDRARPRRQSALHRRHDAPRRARRRRACRDGGPSRRFRRDHDGGIERAVRSRA